MNKAVPAHLQGIAIGLAVGTLAVLGAHIHSTILGLALVILVVSYILDRRQRGDTDD